MRPIHLFFKYFKLKNFLAPYRHWTDTRDWQRYDIHQVLIKSKPNIFFNKSENQEGQNYLEKQKIDKNEKYICAIFRSGEYYNDDNNPRNVQITESLSTIKFFNKRGYKVLLMGGIYPDINIDQNTKGIINYSNSKFKTDLLDLYLIFNSYFNICADTGLRDIAYLNRKPVALSNFVSLEIIPQEDKFTNTAFFIPKKYYSISDNKYVKFSKVFEMELYTKNITELKKLGYKIYNNSEDEILNLWKDTEYLVYNNYKRDDVDNYNKKFREIYKDYFGYDIQNLRITEHFLRKNYDIID